MHCCIAAKRPPVKGLQHCIALHCKCIAEYCQVGLEWAVGAPPLPSSQLKTPCSALQWNIWTTHTVCTIPPTARRPPPSFHLNTGIKHFHSGVLSTNCCVRESESEIHLIQSPGEYFRFHQNVQYIGILTYIIVVRGLMVSWYHCLLSCPGQIQRSIWQSLPCNLADCHFATSDVYQNIKRHPTTQRTCASWILMSYSVLTFDASFHRLRDITPTNKRAFVTLCHNCNLLGLMIFLRNMAMFFANIWNPYYGYWKRCSMLPPQACD